MIIIMYNHSNNNKHNNNNSNTNDDHDHDYDYASPLGLKAGQGVRVREVAGTWAHTITCYNYNMLYYAL